MSELKYFDIHSHLNFPDYDEDREEVVDRMKENSVGTISIGTDLGTSQHVVRLAETYPQMYASIGMHPADGKEHAEHMEVMTFEKQVNEFKKIAIHPKVVAIGECGLDYGRDSNATDDEKQRQKKDFLAQIHFAHEYNKPMMIHARNSHDDILDILEAQKKEFGERLRGNAHFFTGTVTQAQRYLDLNFSLSFTGVITFARDYDDVVRYAPADMIMSETDAPFVAPVPYRRTRNEPSYVIEIVKKIAEIRGEKVEIMQAQLLKNALNRFSIAQFEA